MNADETPSQSEPAAPARSRDEQIREVLKYWTPERMAETKPFPLPKVDPAIVPAQKPGSAKPESQP